MLSPSINGSGATALTPDDVLAGSSVEGRVVIYDDEHYAMGGALAERFAGDGHDVTLVTPETKLSAWTAMTDEQFYIQRKLLEMGVEPVLAHKVTGIAEGVLQLECIYTGRPLTVDCDTLVLVTGRLPDRSLFDKLSAARSRLDAAGIRTVTRIGDCLVPSSIADAVHGGHRYARELDEPVSNTPLPRERPQIL